LPGGSGRQVVILAWNGTGIQYSNGLFVGAIPP
jgi:hypothetical protein